MNSILSGDMCLELKGVERSEAGLQGCASSRDCTLHCLASAEKLPLICIRGTRGIGKTHQLMQMGQLLTSQKVSGLFMSTSTTSTSQAIQSITLRRDFTTKVGGYFC